MLENPAHDAVASAVNLDAGLIAVIAHITDCVSVDLTILKFDAVGDALHVLFGDFLCRSTHDRFFLDKFGVRELRGEIAVVCEQKHAGSVQSRRPTG